eukprot:TRINITY_DN16295_c0_g1_i1.p1 TRINITY_DN16295_c0_g1~~TRINITY_DN16295_c0_g1_i1.p1  ORF type:complete len:176 (-),score=3.17 TRINITY_DN16295_c0_g1_i1:323-850(-)
MNETNSTISNATCSANSTTPEPAPFRLHMVQAYDYNNFVIFFLVTMLLSNLLLFFLGVIVKYTKKEHQSKYIAVTSVILLLFLLQQVTSGYQNIFKHDYLVDCDALSNKLPIFIVYLVYLLLDVLQLMINLFLYRKNTNDFIIVLIIFSGVFPIMYFLIFTPNLACYLEYFFSYV